MNFTSTKATSSKSLIYFHNANAAKFLINPKPKKSEKYKKPTISTPYAHFHLPLQNKILSAHRTDSSPFMRSIIHSMLFPKSTEKTFPNYSNIDINNILSRRLNAYQDILDIEDNKNKLKIEGIIKNTGAQFSSIWADNWFNDDESLKLINHNDIKVKQERSKDNQDLSWIAIEKLIQEIDECNENKDKAKDKVDTGKGKDEESNDGCVMISERNKEEKQGDLIKKREGLFRWQTYNHRFSWNNKSIIPQLLKKFEEKAHCREKMLKLSKNEKSGIEESAIKRRQKHTFTFTGFKGKTWSKEPAIPEENEGQIKFKFVKTAIFKERHKHLKKHKFLKPDINEIVATIEENIRCTIQRSERSKMRLIKVLPKLNIEKRNNENGNCKSNSINYLSYSTCQTEDRVSWRNKRLKNNTNFYTINQRKDIKRKIKMKLKNPLYKVE